MQTQGHCVSCLKPGHEGRARNFLCKDCVSPDFVSTYCRTCGSHSRKSAEEATIDLSYVTFGFPIQNGTVLVFETCGTCEPEKTSRCEMYAIE